MYINMEIRILWGILSRRGKLLTGCEVHFGGSWKEFYSGNGTFIPDHLNNLTKPYILPRKVIENFITINIRENSDTDHGIKRVTRAQVK